MKLTPTERYADNGLDGRRPRRAVTSMPVHLSSVVGSPLFDSGGERLGRIEDLIARLDGAAEQPPVVGLKARIGGRELLVPASRLASLGTSGAYMVTTKLNLARFQLRQGEVLLRADVLGRSLIDTTAARLVRAREIELVYARGSWRVAGIDPTLAARLRRLLPRRLRTHRAQHARFVGWWQMEPFVGPESSTLLRLTHRRLARLHPAQLADLVEAASHAQGEEILQAVAQDEGLQAGVFEELDDERRREFLRDRSDGDVAALLCRLSSDDAVDLLLQLDQERRLPVLNLLPDPMRGKVRGLLGYNPQTAGGIMSPDFISVSDHATVAGAIAAIRTAEIADHDVQAVYLADARGHLIGALELATLLRATNTQVVARLSATRTPAVPPNADIPAIARTMADYDLLSLPVVDPEGRVIGVIALDDVVGRILPTDWRRRHGDARG